MTKRSWLRSLFTRTGTRQPRLQTSDRRPASRQSRAPKLELLELRDLPNNLFSLVGSSFFEPFLDLNDSPAKNVQQTNLVSAVLSQFETQTASSSQGFSLGVN